MGYDIYVHMTTKTNANNAKMPSAKIVIMRKIKTQEDWFEIYMQCPSTFGLAPRTRKLYPLKHSLEGSLA